MVLRSGSLKRSLNKITQCRVKIFMPPYSLSGDAQEPQYEQQSLTHLFSHDRKLISLIIDVRMFTQNIQ